MPPVEISYRGLTPSPAIETAIHAWVERLAHVHDRIQHCHVWLTLPHGHHRHGPRFQVRLTVAIPGRDIAITHDAGHEDAYLALADAFVAARRQLVDRARIRRGDRRAA